MGVIFGLDEDTVLEVAYERADDEWYTVRAITDGIRESWRKSCFKGKHRDRTGAEVEVYDEKLRWELMVDHIFAGWRGAIYLNRDDAAAKRTSECTLQNKLIFAGTQTERMTWAIEVAQSLGERLAKKLEAQRENFRPAHAVSAGLPEAELSGL